MCDGVQSKARMKRILGSQRPGVPGMNRIVIALAAAPISVATVAININGDLENECKRNNQ